MKREVAIGSAVRMGVLAWSVVVVGVWIAAAADPQMFYAAIGVSALFIVLSPFLLLNRYDLFSPWSIVLLTILVGCCAPAVATSLRWPSDDYVSTFSLLSQDVQYFYYPGIVLLLGLACLTAGYFCIPHKGSLKFSMGRTVSPTRLYIVAFLCVAISFMATGAYIVFTGGATSSQISGKRTKIQTLNVQDDAGFSQYGYLRSIATLSNIALLALLGFWTSQGQRITQIRFFILISILLLACAIPFYSSSRASLVWLFLAALGVYYYSHQKHFFAITVSVTAAATLAVAFMTIARNENADVSDKFMFLGRNLVYSRNGPELAKTAHIINGLPEKLDFQYGKTIAVWLIAPIPRELFPQKPLIHYGPVIGRNIYGNNISGVPPGLIGEMYLNFHIPGVIFGCLFFGWALRKSYEFLFSISGDSIVIICIYLFAFLPLAFKVLGNSFGSGILCFVDCALFLFAAYMFTVPVQRYQPSVPNRQLRQFTR